MRAAIWTVTIEIPWMRERGDDHQDDHHGDHRWRNLAEGVTGGPRP